MIYRHLAWEDAERFWTLMDRLDRETRYMLYEPGERSHDLDRVNEVIEAAREDDFLLCAEVDGTLVGYLSAQRGRQRRIAHSAYIVVGLLREYRGKGIGTELFKRLDAWARERGITRLELTVVAENEPAKHLYEKSGFAVEGVKRSSIRLDGRYVDEYYMAKLLEEEVR